MPRARALLLLAVAGCTPEFASVDAACPDEIAGEEFAGNGGAEALRRVSCYRRYVGLEPAVVDEKVQLAATNHASWMATNGLWLNEETAGTEGFTGSNAVQRLAAVGYTLDEVNYGVWDAIDDAVGHYGDADTGDADPGHSVWFTRPDTPAAVIDAWMDDFIFRQAVLQPAWFAGGWAWIDDRWIAANIVYRFPATENINAPIVWPRDGARDVPTTYVSLWPNEDHPMPTYVALGYPISITVGSNQAAGTYVDANPYDLVLEEADLRGPDGSVAVYVVQPDDVTAYDMPFTVALIPTEPLAPDTDYTFEAVVAYGNGKDRPVTSRFRTASADGRAARAIVPIEASWLRTRP